MRGTRDIPTDPGATPLFVSAFGISCCYFGLSGLVRPVHLIDFLPTNTVALIGSERAHTVKDCSLNTRSHRLGKVPMKSFTNDNYATIKRNSAIGFDFFSLNFNKLSSLYVCLSHLPFGSESSPLGLKLRIRTG